MKRHRTSICSGTQRNVAESGWPAWVFGGDDVRFSSHPEASAWGRRSVVVRVWE